MDGFCLYQVGRMLEQELQFCLEKICIDNIKTQHTVDKSVQNYNNMVNIWKISDSLPTWSEFIPYWMLKILNWLNILYILLVCHSFPPNIHKYNISVFMKINTSVFSLVCDCGTFCICFIMYLLAVLCNFQPVNQLDNY